jgi:hypothetical protein
MTPRRLPFVTAAMLAALALTAPGSAAGATFMPDPAVDDSPDVAVAGGAEGGEQGTGLSFAIGDGKLAGRKAMLELGGWLILRGADRILALSSPVAVVNGRRGFLAMSEDLQGRRVRLLELSDVQRSEPKDGRVSLAGEARLSAAGASLLRRAFGAKQPAGTEVGRLEADVALVPPTTDPGPVQEPVGEPAGE